MDIEQEADAEIARINARIAKLEEGISCFNWSIFYSVIGIGAAVATFAGIFKDSPAAAVCGFALQLMCMAASRYWHARGEKIKDAA